MSDRDLKNDEWISFEELIATDVKKYTTPGLALQGARLKNNLSPSALAKLIGIRPESMSKLENGKRPIAVGLAKKFAGVLNVDYHVFLS